MSNIKEFVDEHDLDAADVIDALDIDPSEFANVPEEPTAFYDGEPTVDDLRDDFEAVDMLAEKREELEGEIDGLREEVREARRPVFADKAEELATLTERWGDEDELMEHFDADDEDQRWSVDDIDEKIELAEDILEDNDTTTTVTDSGGSEESPEPDIQTTASGKYDLRRQTKPTN